MSEPATAPDWPRPAIGWYAVGVLTVAYVLSFIDRSILTLLVGPIRADLGISDTQLSLLHGFAFAIFYTTLGIPVALLADRLNRRNIIAIGIAVWSVATALCGLGNLALRQGNLPEAATYLADALVRSRQLDMQHESARVLNTLATIAELEGDLDLHTFLGLGDGNAGFSAIQATVHIESDADDETIETLHRKVVSTSPVGHTLSRSIPLDVTRV